jgi:hypothetical protein
MATNLDILPTEIVELITTSLSSLKDVSSLRLVSRALSTRSENPFGNQYFSHLKFYLQPHNLRALSDFSREGIAKYVQVLGFQFPHSNALRPGLIDPMHDADVPENRVSMVPDGEVHEDMERPVKTLIELTSVRMDADIATITQALKRMPKLLEVRTGNFADEQLRGLRAPMQIPQQDTISCVQGHCRPNVLLRHEQLYHVVIAAISRISRPAGKELTLSLAVNSFSPMIDLQPSMIALLSKMNTRAQISFDNPQQSVHCNWLTSASALELRYSRLPGNPASPLPAISTPLTSLTIFQGTFSTKGSVSGLSALLRPLTKNLITFLDHHKDTLVTVRLLQSRMVSSNMHDPGTWRLVLRKLGEMARLGMLEMDKLKSEVNERDHLGEESGKEVVLRWQWRKEEVKEGLARLEEVHQTVVVREWVYLNLHAGT